MWQYVEIISGIFDTMLAYQHSLSEPLENVQLIVQGVHDRAYVLADNNFVKVGHLADLLNML